MNILLAADLHLADLPPSSRKEGYAEELLDLLRQTVILADEHDAVMVWAGDVFHIKTPSRNSHKLVNSVIEIVKSYPHGLYIVPGNHDLSQDRLDSLPGQPLGTLFNAGAKMLSGWAEDAPIYGVPWLQRFTDKTVFDALSDWRMRVPDMGNCLVVTHAPLYPPGRELKYEFYGTSEWASAMNFHGSTFYGHVHDPHGAYTVEGVTFCNNGALSRGSLTESNLTRPVVATLWSSINGMFRPIPLASQPSQEIFRMEVKETRTKQLKLDEFLVSLGCTSIPVTTTDAVMDYVRSLSLSPAVEEAIKDLLESS